MQVVKKLFECFFKKDKFIKINYISYLKINYQNKIKLLIKTIDD